MSTSSSDECAFAFTAHRSGVGIGPNGIYGYGTTPASAMYNLVTNIEEFLKELAKQKAKEEEDAIRGENE